MQTQISPMLVSSAMETLRFAFYEAAFGAGLSRDRTSTNIQCLVRLARQIKTPATLLKLIFAGRVPQLSQDTL